MHWTLEISQTMLTDHFNGELVRLEMKRENSKTLVERRQISTSLQYIDIIRYHLVSTDVPDSSPITSLLSKWSRRSSTVENLPKL